MFCFRLISVPDYLTATRKLTPQAQLMQSWTRCFHHRWRGSSFWHRKCRNRICSPHQDRHQPVMPAVKSLSICAKRKTALCQQHTCQIHFASGQIARTFMTNWVAEDIIPVPASQAYVERVFSVCGMLTTGRRNRTTKSLEMRAFLKLNRKVGYWPPPASICLSEQYCLNWSWYHSLLVHWTTDHFE